MHGNQALLRFSRFGQKPRDKEGNLTMKAKNLWKLVILGVILALVATQCAPPTQDSAALEEAKAEVAAAQATAEAALAEAEAAKAAAAGEEMPSEAGDKPKPYEGTVLRMLAPYEPVSWVIPDMVNEFYKETGIRVAVDLLPGGAMLQKMVSEFQAETGFYDVFRESPSWIPDHTAAGWLEPVNDLIERDRDEIDVDDFISSVWGTHTMVGLFPDQIWGLPLNVTTRILVYDRQLFEDPDEQAAFKEQYGYDLAPPKTTQEWLDMAEFFTRDTDGDGEIDLWGHISPQKQGFPRGHVGRADAGLDLRLRDVRRELQRLARRPPLPRILEVRPRVEPVHAGCGARDGVL